MSAQTVCPRCHTELKLKAGRTAGAAAVECPRCGAAVPPAPSDSASSVVARGGDESTGRDAPRPTPRTTEFAFLSPPQAPDEIGRLGHYRVLGELGRGGMGVVFRAEDAQMARPAALKVMLPQFAASPTDKARFLREARAQARVEHHHVAAIFEVGEDRGVAFLAMPLLKGLSLAEALRAGPRVPVAEAVRIAREMAEGLAAAHEGGLVHRDIKPGNVWLEGARRRVKILDFGLARPTADADADAAASAEITRQGAIIGTPAYMSPEQARGEQLDARSDLFSLGVVLYQLLTGRQPFRAANVTGVLIAVATEAPPPPSDLNADVPAALDAVAAALLAKHPDDRPPTADAVADLLQAIEEAVAAPGTTVLLPPAGAAADPWDDIDATAAEPIEPATRPAPTTGGRARRWVAAGIAAAAVAVAVAVAAAVLGSRPADDHGEKAAARPAPAAAAPRADARKPDTPTPDRKAAEYVLSVGGVVHVNDSDVAITQVSDLPAAPFELTGVGVRHCERVTDAGLECLRGCKHLKTLDLYSNPQLGDATVALVKEFPRLTLLFVASMRVTDEGMAAAKDLKEVTHLHLVATGLTDAGLAHFKSYTKLKFLHCGGMNVGDAGFGHFKGCRELAFLGLGGTKVTDAGLAPVRGMAALDTLELMGTAVTDAGLVHLADCKRLKSLDLTKTKVTAAGVAGVRRALPECRVVWDESPDADRAAAAFALSLGGAVGVNGAAEPRKALPAVPFALTHLLLDGTPATDADVARFRGCTAVAHLSLAGTRVTDEALDDDVRHFRALTRIDLRRTAVTARCVARLARALPRCTIVWDGGVVESLADLRAADLRAAEYVVSIGGAVRVDDGTRDIRAAADLPPAGFRLTRIDLHDNKKVTDGGLAVLTGCAHLTQLLLRGAPVTDVTLARLRDNKGLTELYLGATKITDAGLAHLAGCKNLTGLWLYGTAVTDAGMAHFAGCDKLVHVNLSNTKIGDAGLAHLAGAKRLTHLYLGGTAVTDAGLAHFKDCADLRYLWVNGSPVTDAGLAHFKACPRLYWLNIADTAVTDAGLAHFARCQSLVWVNARKTKATADGIAVLKDALPNCKIEWDGGTVLPKAP